MSYFHRTSDTLEEPKPPQKPSAGSRLADFGDRIARAFAALDRGPVDQPVLEPGEDPAEDVVGFSPPGVTESSESDLTGRFPVGPFGYNRAAVDDHIAELELELEQLRREPLPPMSITEEIERIGEQTASILVVAHDQAHETARRAQEQADRCIADAASNAIEITERATRRLRELDNETDAVWRERQRLLEDVRGTGRALIALAEEATERFPEDTKSEVEPAVGKSEAEPAVGKSEVEPAVGKSEVEPAVGKSEAEPAREVEPVIGA